jgi:hypothetical protein
VAGVAAAKCIDNLVVNSSLRLNREQLPPKAKLKGNLIFRSLFLTISCPPPPRVIVVYKLLSLLPIFYVIYF